MDLNVHDHQAGEQANEPIHLRHGAVSTVAVTDIKEHDILLGRGKSNANHIGNVLFQGESMFAGRF